MISWCMELKQIIQNWICYLLQNHFETWNLCRNREALHSYLLQFHKNNSFKKEEYQSFWPIYGINIQSIKKVPEVLNKRGLRSESKEVQCNNNESARSAVQLPTVATCELGISARRTEEGVRRSKVQRRGELGALCVFLILCDVLIYGKRAIVKGLRERVNRSRE